MLTTKIGKVGKLLICGMKGVASVDSGRGSREILRLHDSAGLQGKVQLPRHYIHFPDGFALVYDPTDPSNLDMLADIN
ncbi:hypothetical protein GQX74_009643 [Glossina fuscipes]|nr:hypothetical protein GQX74_009643 [Glossina fuscipes]